jgi:hypothetical protein
VTKRKPDFTIAILLVIFGTIGGLLALSAKKPFLFGFAAFVAPPVVIALTLGGLLVACGSLWEKFIGEEPPVGVAIGAIVLYIFVLAPLAVTGLRGLGVRI